MARTTFSRISASLYVDGPNYCHRRSPNLLLQSSSVVVGALCRTGFCFGIVLLVHHGPRYFEDVPIFALGYTVLLRSVSASEFSPNSFLSEIRREVVREVLLAAIRSQASYMSTSGFFDFVLECLEMSEHFTLLPHWVDSGVPGEVVDEGDEISAPAKTNVLCQPPYIGMYQVKLVPAPVSLVGERKHVYG